MNEKSKAAICTDEIEAAVYAQLKPLGFRKYGRTLHRFVSGDLSQVIHFQCGFAVCGPRTANVGQSRHPHTGVRRAHLFPIATKTVLPRIQLHPALPSREH